MSGSTVSFVPSLSQASINVANYGIVGNGVADDSPAIMNAAAAAKAAGYRILAFPPGTYNVPTLTGAALTDSIWVGDGATLTNCTWNKYIVPSDAPDAPPPPCTINPLVHLKNSIRQAASGDTVTVLITGDSIASMQANGAGLFVAEPFYLMSKIRRDNPGITFNFLVYPWGGQTFHTFNNNFVTATSTLTNPFTTTNASNIVSVAWTAHGLIAGQVVVFSGASAVGGLTLNGTYVVNSVTNANAITIAAASNATSGAGPGGGTVTYNKLTLPNYYFSGNQGGPNWWQFINGGTQTWVQAMAGLAPQLTIILFCSNDAQVGINLADFTASIATLQAAGSDVILATHTSRSYDASATVGSDFTAAQNTLNDGTAGFIASYANANGLGCIDTHRQGCIIRDGYDQRSTSLMVPQQYAPVINPNGSYTGLISELMGPSTPFVVQPTYDLAMIIRDFGTYGSPALTGPGEVQIQIGSPALDNGNLLRIGRDSGTGNFYYQVDNCLSGTSSAFAQIPKTVTSTPCNFGYDGSVWVWIAVRGSELSICWGQVGTSDWQVLVHREIARFGGLFSPRITSSNSWTLNISSLAVSDISNPRFFLPKLTNREVWGNEDYNPQPGWGGNSGVHPTSLHGEYIYRPVIEAQNFALSDGSLSSTIAPAIYFGATPSVATGTFTARAWQTGRYVDVIGSLTWTSTPAETGNLEVFLTGMPVALNAIGNQPILVTQTASITGVSNGASSLHLNAFVLQNTNGIGFQITGTDSGTTAIANTNITNGSVLKFSGRYIRA